MLLFEFFFLAAALLIVSIALRRVSAAEAEVEVLRRRIARRDRRDHEEAALALELAAAVRGRAEYAAASARIDALVLADETLETQAVFAAARGVSLHRLYDDVGAVEGPLSLWRRALQRMVRAAIEAAPEGLGDVSLLVGELDGDLVFCVSDDGPGSAAEDPLVAGHAVAAAIAEATGAGFVRETEPGGGTRVALRVPLPCAGKTPIEPGIEPLHAETAR